MKVVILALALALALNSVACTRFTPYGECIGLDDEKDPGAVYEVNTWNVVGAIIFAETIIIPVWVAFEAVYCPVRYKTASPVNGRKVSP